MGITVTASTEDWFLYLTPDSVTEKPVMAPVTNLHACRLGYHQWYAGICFSCELMEKIHRNPLNCVYCNRMHVGNCYPEVADQTMYSGWTYKPKRPDEAQTLDHLPVEDPRRFLTEDDLAWLKDHGYNLYAHLEQVRVVDRETLYRASINR